MKSSQNQTDPSKSTNNSANASKETTIVNGVDRTTDNQSAKKETSSIQFPKTVCSQPSNEPNVPQSLTTVTKTSQLSSSPAPVDSSPNTLLTNLSRHKTTPTPSNKLRTLSEMKDLAESDCFVQLVEKEKLRTKDGKPYYKVTFRDRRKTVQSLFWFEGSFFLECENAWKIGDFFKIRGAIRDAGYGSKLEIRRIRKVVPEDKNDGFNARKCQPSSERPPEEIVAELLAIADKQIGKGPLLNLVRRIFKESRLQLFDAAASRVHHRPYIGGLIEHTLSVTRLAIMIYDHFCVEFPWLTARVSKPLVVAGALLHDVGKILDSHTSISGAQKTFAGKLISHQILGVGLVQRFLSESSLDDNTTYQLEHLILTHSRFPEWGSPSPPQTLEAMILHYADYADATFVSSMKILEEDVAQDTFSQRKGPFGVPVMKPLRRSNHNAKGSFSDSSSQDQQNNEPTEEPKKVAETTLANESNEQLGSNFQET